MNPSTQTRITVMKPDTQTRINVFSNLELDTVTVHLAQYMELRPDDARKLAAELVQAADYLKSFDKSVEEYFNGECNA